MTEEVDTKRLAAEIFLIKQIEAQQRGVIHLLEQLDRLEQQNHQNLAREARRALAHMQQLLERMQKHLSALQRYQQRHG